MDLNDCKQLQTLCLLRRLKKLNMMFCKRLMKLLESFSNLSKLEELRLYRCKVLWELPPSIHGLKELRILHMESMALEELPEDFGQLVSLREVELELQAAV